MWKIGRYQAVEESLVSGLSNVFAVAELAKHRRRHIIEPLLNDILFGGDLGDIVLPGPADVRRGLKKYALQFDAAAFYDQFALSPGVSSFFSFRSRSSPTGFARYSRLPMGFRPSCFVAQESMLALADLAPEGVTALVYIDNVLFTADDEDLLLRAGALFRSRCLTCGVTLNDPHLPLESLVVPVQEFLGVEYDLESRTCRNTQKTVEKLHAARLALTNPLSLRSLAAVFGLLFWCQQVVPLRLAPFFAALAAFRHLPLEAQSPTRWNARAPLLSAEAHSQLLAWIDACIARPCRPLVEPDVPAPEFRVWVDASAFGWGALVERTSDSSVLRLGRPWSAEDRATYNVASSVVAEPLGFRRAVLAVCTENTRAIEVHTDHQPLMFAWRAGRGRVAAYNDCVAAVQSALPHLHVDVQYVRGVDNIHADDISRGRG